MFKNYNYDGSIKKIAASKQKEAGSTSNKTGTGYDEFEDVLQNQANVIKDDPDARYNEGISLGDPESADIRIVGLGHSESGNSSLMLRLFYNEYDEEIAYGDNKLLQWEQHQMNYKYSDKNGDDDILRISYFDLKGFDDILSKQEMEQRIANVINHSFNCILLYYSISNKSSFKDGNGFTIQDIKVLVEKYLNLIDAKKFLLILVGLKLDAEDDGDRVISTTEGENLAKKWGIPFIECSSKSGVNIQGLLDLICGIYTRRFEVIDGDLNEAAAFDEDKVTQKIIIKEDDEYDEYKEKEPETLEDIMINNYNDLDYDDEPQEAIIITNDDGIDDDDDMEYNQPDEPKEEEQEQVDKEKEENVVNEDNEEEYNEPDEAIKEKEEDVNKDKDLTQKEEVNIDDGNDETQERESPVLPPRGRSKSPKDHALHDGQSDFDDDDPNDKPNDKPLRQSPVPPPRFYVHDHVLYNGQEAEIMRILNQNQIEISYPTKVNITKRQKSVVSPQQLQVIDICEFVII